MSLFEIFVNWCLWNIDEIVVFYRIDKIFVNVCIYLNCYFL